MGKFSRDKLASKQAVIEKFQDGQTILLGGFNRVGAPGTLFKYLHESAARDLTLVCNNCSNDPAGIWYPASQVISEGRVRQLKISFTRTNTELISLYESRKLEVELIPQGTLAERIRAAAYGLGGFLTTVGYGTLLAEGKQIIHANGKDYLLELPLHADLALVKATKADLMGNAVCRATTKNFNTIMAPAADFTILEADQIVPVGELTPEEIDIPGIFVDMVIQSEEVLK
ncbi:MAG TPA: CoA transferase subunit A [Anaerolineaceae bacterium]|mgnify:CR=1 FL=1|nr:CoA transferase subunit A [Anaerolineaceae bacterium]